MPLRKAHIIVCRLLLIVWTSAWITALPLFHTHLPGVFQRVGTPHTVFSQDLPGEYRAFAHKTVPSESDLSVLAPNSPELGFVASLKEDGTGKPWQEGDAVVSVPFAPPALLRSQWIPGPALIDPNSWSPSRHGLRAPPQPVSI